MTSFKFSERPLNVEAGAAARVFKGAVAGATAGGTAGALAGATVLGVGALFAGWAGVMVGGVAGIAWGMRSSDPEKIRNRPLSIDDPLVGEKTVYVSAEQWRELKARMAQGFTYDEFPAPLDRQFESAAPPEPSEA
jgi:phage tail tape-measure protein